MATNMLLWKKWRNPLFYPQRKALERKFSTKLFTLSTVSVEKDCGKKENRCVFCGFLKSPKIRHFYFSEKYPEICKSNYGN